MCRKWIVLALVVLCSVGCGRSPDLSELEEQEENPFAQEINKETITVSNQKLIVSRRNDEDQLIRIGVLEFADSVTLTLEPDVGEEGAALKSVWDEVASAEELTWKQAVPGERNGKKVTRIVGKQARPGEESYIYAVMNTLERRHGYRVGLTE